jgi:hypothetical protein
LFYYRKYFKKIFKENSYYCWVIVLAIILAVFIYARNIDKDKITLVGEQNVKILIIRDTVLDGEANKTLGKIISEGKLKNKLILMATDMFTDLRIGQIVVINSKIEENKYMANVFDVLFFGRVDYQTSFPKIEVVDKINGFYFSKMISFVRNTVDNKIKA